MDSIADARAAFVAALSLRDARAASAVYTDDARLLPPASEPVRGREAIGRFWQAGLEAGISSARFDEIELRERAGLAYEIGRYELGLEPPDGNPVLDSGTYVHVHERQPDGSWRRAVEMFSPAATHGVNRAPGGQP